MHDPTLSLLKVGDSSLDRSFPPVQLTSITSVLIISYGARRDAHCTRLIGRCHGTSVARSSMVPQIAPESSNTPTTTTKPLPHASAILTMASVDSSSNIFRAIAA